MTVKPRLEFVYGQVAWMCGVMIVLVLLGSLSYELFFAGSFIGLLVLTEYTSPPEVTPIWRQRLRWLILAGFFVFSLIIVDKIREVLPPGMV